MKLRARLLNAGAIAAIAIGMVAAAGSLGAAAQSVPGAAQGDSYAAYGQLFVVGQGPVFVGPIQPSRAAVPPTSTQGSSASVLDYVSCQQPSPVGTCASFQQP